MQTTLLGRKARELLVQPSDAVVTGWGSHAMYFLHESGEVFWLADAATPPHARAVLLGGDLPLWLPGTSCGSTGHSLTARGRPGITLHAPVWTPPAPTRTVSWGTVWARTQRLADSFSFSPPRWVGEAREAARSGDLEELLHWGQKLVGLGPGLTPLGDDFLGGALFAAWLASHLVPGWRWAEAKLEEFLICSRERTSRLSATLLADLAHGEGPAPLHHLAHVLLSGGSSPALWQAAHELVQVGHSSGLACLQGFCAVWSQPSPQESEGNLARTQREN